MLLEVLAVSATLLLVLLSARVIGELDRQAAAAADGDDAGSESTEPATVVAMYRDPRAIGEPGGAAIKSAIR